MSREEPLESSPMNLFILTVLAAAYLLFVVQPLFGKYVLPWFGGSPAVWLSCLLFFQTVLLAGYAYAHALVRIFRPRAQAAVHCALLLAALAVLPIAPDAAWKPAASDEPVARLLALLASCLGLPLFVLSATAPLLQAWHASLYPGVSPYRLYAFSNTGALLALVSYPLAIEPMWTRSAQSAYWAAGLGLVALLTGACAWLLWRARRTTLPGEVAQADNGTVVALPALSREPAPPFALSGWILVPALAACGSMLLLACTNKLCEDVTSAPVLWVLPLGLYLLTYVLCFLCPRCYRRRVLLPLLALALLFLCIAMFRQSRLSMAALIGAYGTALWAGCMVCHGELYRLRPAPRHLTTFYLLMAAGGVCGSAFVVLAAPRIFRSYAELHWAAGFLAGLVAVVLGRERVVVHCRARHWPAWPIALCGAVALGLALYAQSRYAARDVVASVRGFHGALQVRVVKPDDSLYRAVMLRHGQITHGLQFTEPSKADLPTCFYGEMSGVGLALRHGPWQSARRIGVVGLGVGTLAAYGRPGDVMRFYEINPDVIRLARTRFTYLERSRARVEIVPGDARLSLEREVPQGFDVLVLDAFNSDAIPVHLLTREAFGVYLRHVKAGGAIAVHISNLHLNLYPVMRGLAGELGLETAFVHGPEREWPSLWWYSPSMWALLTKGRGVFAAEPFRAARQPPAADLARSVVWTDDYASLLPLVRR